MTRKTAADFDPRILDLFDGYVHGQMSKRDFLRRAGRFTLAGVSAAALLEALQPDYALALQVPIDDPDIRSERVRYASPDGHGEVEALMARPRGEGPFGAVLVVHENRGLNPYIEDVVRRCAKAGYLALGPDGLTSLGGYPGNDDDGRVLQRQLDPQRLLADFFAGFEHLAGHPLSTGRVGAVGFCYGGGVCNASPWPIRIWPVRCPITADRRLLKMCRPSKRPCSFTMPAMMIASMPAGRTTRPRSKRAARPLRRMSTRP